MHFPPYIPDFENHQALDKIGLRTFFQTQTYVIYLSAKTMWGYQHGFPLAYYIQ